MDTASLDVDCIRARILALDASNEPLDDAMIDQMFGLRVDVVEAGIAPLERIIHFPDERSTYEGAPYDAIRRFYQWANPGEEDVIYDVGAGYGRVLLYGGLICRAKLCGIELIRARVDEANRVRARLGLGSVQFSQGNAREAADLDDGTVFFVHNFSFPT